MLVMEIMVKDVITLSPDETLKEAALKFSKNNISGAPVVDDKGHVIGIVSEADIIATLERNLKELKMVYLSPSLSMVGLSFTEKPSDKKTEEVFKEVETLARKAEQQYSVRVSLEKVQEESSPETSEDSEVVLRMRKALRDVLGVEPKVVGVGGGTCAGHFRKAGFPAVVCGTGDETAHNVNEYVIVDNLVKDAKIYAALFLG